MLDLDRIPLRKHKACHHPSPKPGHFTVDHRQQVPFILPMVPHSLQHYMHNLERTLHYSCSLLVISRTSHSHPVDHCTHLNHREDVCTTAILKEFRHMEQQVGLCSMLCPRASKVLLKFLLDLVVDAATYCSRITGF